MKIATKYGLGYVETYADHFPTKLLKVELHEWLVLGP